MKRLLYRVLHMYLRLGLRFYFRKRIIHGMDRFPEKKPVLIVANHQNAFLDALLIAAVTKRELHFLARADVFDVPVLRTFLRAINLMPVYRVRDGLRGVHRNGPIFSRCAEILAEGGVILIFPEGNHSMLRRVRPISKGFTRLVDEAMKLNPQLDLQLLPMGINYEVHEAYRSGVSLYVGTPISVQKHVASGQTWEQLKEPVQQAMQKLTAHIPASEYRAISQQLEEEGVDYLDPVATNERISVLQAELGEMEERVPRMNALGRGPLYPLIVANNLLFVFLWRRVRPRFKDRAFHASLKVVFGLFVYPFCALLQASLVGWFTSTPVAISYAVVSFLTLPLLAVRLR